MKPGEFVYRAVRDEAIKKGADVRFAEDEARVCFNAYKENRFPKKVSDLIDSHIKAAVKRTEERRKSLL